MQVGPPVPLSIVTCTLAWVVSADISVKLTRRRDP